MSPFHEFGLDQIHPSFQRDIQDDAEFVERMTGQVSEQKVHRKKVKVNG